MLDSLWDDLAAGRVDEGRAVSLLKQAVLAASVQPVPWHVKQLLAELLVIRGIHTVCGDPGAWRHVWRVLHPGLLYSLLLGGEAAKKKAVAAMRAVVRPAGSAAKEGEGVLYVLASPRAWYVGRTRVDRMTGVLGGFAARAWEHVHGMMATTRRQTRYKHLGTCAASLFMLPAVFAVPVGRVGAMETIAIRSLAPTANTLHTDRGQRVRTCERKRPPKHSRRKTPAPFQPGAEDLESLLGTVSFWSRPEIWLRARARYEQEVRAEALCRPGAFEQRYVYEQTLREITEKGAGPVDIWNDEHVDLRRCFFLSANQGIWLPRLKTRQDAADTLFGIGAWADMLVPKPRDKVRRKVERALRRLSLPPLSPGVVKLPAFRGTLVKLRVRVLGFLAACIQAHPLQAVRRSWLKRVRVFTGRAPRWIDEINAATETKKLEWTALADTTSEEREKIFRGDHLRRSSCYWKLPKWEPAETDSADMVSLLQTWLSRAMLGPRVMHRMRGRAARVIETCTADPMPEAWEEEEKLLMQKMFNQSKELALEN